MLCFILSMPTAKAELAELGQRVDKVWAARLEQPDPLLQGCQREEVSLGLSERGV
jgi:hypothetical protein